MVTMKTLGLAVGMAVAASSCAFAQYGPAWNSAASGGSGTHQTAPRTGSAMNTEKIHRNHSGYRGLYAFETNPYVRRRIRRRMR